MSVTLRYYQREAIDAVLAAEARGINRQLIVLPTGGGKSVVASHIPVYRPESTPMLILAHREELLDQMVAHLQRANPDLVVAVEQGQRFAGHVDIVIASVPTLGRANSKRLQVYPPDYFKVILTDEAHHAAAPTYRRIHEYFADALRIGITATPKRGDNVGLSEVYDEIVYVKTILEMIEEGWLVDLVGYRLTTNVDLSDVRVIKGQYVESELEEAVNVDARNEAIVEGYIKYGLDEGRRAAVFCAGVAHAHDVAKHFHDASIDARAVWGAMDKELRADTLRAHRAGEFPVLTNVGVLTEGYDDPAINMIIMGRPGKSTTPFIQAVGRGLRTAEGKTDCVVLDVVDITKQHRPISLASVLGLPIDFDLEGKKATEAVSAFKKIADAAPSLIYRIKSLADIEATWEKIDIWTPPPVNEALLEWSTLLWIESGDEHYTLNFDRGDSLVVRSDTLGTWHVEAVADGKPESIVNVETQADAFRAADAWAKQNRDAKVGFLKANARWRSDPPSEKQIKILKRNSIPYEHLTKGQASQLLDKLFASQPKKKRPPWLEAKIREQNTSKFKF